MDLLQRLLVLPPRQTTPCRHNPLFRPGRSTFASSMSVTQFASGHLHDMTPLYSPYDVPRPITPFHRQTIDVRDAQVQPVWRCWRPFLHNQASSFAHWGGVATMPFCASAKGRVGVGVLADRGVPTRRRNDRGIQRRVPWRKASGPADSDQAIAMVSSTITTPRLLFAGTIAVEERSSGYGQFTSIVHWDEARSGGNGVIQCSTPPGTVARPLSRLSAIPSFGLSIEPPTSAIFSSSVLCSSDL